MAITSVRRIDDRIDRIVGEADDASGSELRHQRVNDICFLNAAPVLPFADYLPGTVIALGETVPVQAELPNACEAFLITVG